MGNARVIAAPTYVALQAALMDELRVATADQEADGLWVLVPTNLLAAHLRREAALSLGGVAGPRFMTLLDAARCLALRSFAERELRPLPEGSLELVLGRILTERPDTSPFAAFRNFPNAPRALAHAIEVLETSLWSPPALAAAGRNGRFRDPGAPARMTKLSDIWARLRLWKQQHRFFDEDDLITRAALDRRDPDECPARLVVYGFYDLTPAQQALVARLAGLAGACSAYVLWAEEDGRPVPGFDYAERTLRWLLDTLGCPGPEPVAPERDKSDLLHLRDAVFRPASMDEPEAARARLEDMTRTWDGTVRVLNCPGASSEATEVVREILRTASASHGPSSVGILLRSAAALAPLLDDALGRTGFEYYLREGLPLADSPTGRTALATLDLANRKARRAEVVAFLGLAQVTFPQDLSAAAIDRLARAAGVILRTQWGERLVGHAEHLQRLSERAEDEEERARLTRDAALCNVAAGFLGEFFQQVEDCVRAAEWSQTALRLRDLVARYAPEDASARQVLDRIDTLAQLDAVDVPPSPQLIRTVLGRALEGTSSRRGRSRRVGLTVSSLMAARGAVFDVVVVPGMQEKVFPQQTPSGSLLTEWDREVLNEVRGPCGTLPAPGERSREERYLFRMALASARRAVVLTWSRLEPDKGRPLIASRFVRDTCAALVGFQVPTQLIEEDSLPGLVTRVSIERGPWQPSDLALAVDPVEYDTAMCDGAAAGATSVAYMGRVSSWFGRAAEAEAGRWGAPRFGSYDGKVARPDLLEQLKHRYVVSDAAISPSRFETYARCPFSFFLTYVLGVKELEVPTSELELPPLERGVLEHELLSRVFAEHLRGRPFGDLHEDAIAELAGRAARILDELGRIHAANHPATWAAEKERILRQFRGLLAFERQEHPTAVPAHFEHTFGESGTEVGYTFGAGPEFTVRFKGRIDRIDELPGRHIQIVDYKTGSRRDRYKPNTLLGGCQLQLPIYLLAAADELDATDGKGFYTFTREAVNIPEFTLAGLRANVERLQHIVRLILEGITHGEFFPLPAPGDNCERTCRYRHVCGAARSGLAEMKAADPAAARLQALRNEGDAG